LGLGGDSDKSAPVLVEGEGRNMPDIPSSLSATAISSSQIKLSWVDNSDNETGFKIERKSGIGGTYSLINTVICNIISYLDTVTPPLITYYYRISGYNDFGDSFYSNETSAMPLIYYAKVKAGKYHTIALTMDNSLCAWGYNGSGQLGLGGTYLLPRVTPSHIGDATDWSFISAEKGNSTLVIKNNGAIWAWGMNSFGELGLGDTDNRSRPNQVGGLLPTHITTLTATLSSLTQVDLSWSETDNEDGLQILRSVTPAPYTLLATFNPDVTSYSDTTVITTAYAYRIKAFNNVGEVLSPLVILNVTDTNIGNSYVVTGVFSTPSLDLDWDMVVTTKHTVARKSNGTLWSWGYNYYGQLGLGDMINRTTPSQIGSASDWSIITIGSLHSVCLKTNCTIWSWGYNYYGQLGDGTANNKYIPIQIGTGSDWTVAVSGYDHTLALKTNGTIWSWGINNYGELGLGDSAYLDCSDPDNPVFIDTTRKTPTQIGTTSDWLAVAAGSSSSYGLNTNYTFWAWGCNQYGQLGLGDTIDRNTPSQIGTQSDWATIEGGGKHTLAIKTNSTLWAWGDNSFGQLGVGYPTNRNVPTLVGE
jgi:alpha-tubulin suppressor-like RCC1 family protein